LRPKQRGAKIKKKLEIDPLHADTVRLIYRLALEGDGTSGQMGVKNIVKPISTSRRIFTRDGGRWGIGASPPHPDPPHLYGRA
jgi:site-specific DNA recombinase